MIRGNRILFGYGTVLTGSKYDAVEFTEIIPPFEVGIEVDPRKHQDEILDQITIRCTHHELSTLIRTLKRVTQVNCMFEFRGYIFDFTKYNPRSIQSCLTASERALRNILMLLAC